MRGHVICLVVFMVLLHHISAQELPAGSDADIRITQSSLLEIIDGAWAAIHAMSVQGTGISDTVMICGNPVPWSGIPWPPISFRRLDYMEYLGNFYRLTNNPDNCVLVARNIETNAPILFTYFQIDEETILLAEIRPLQEPLALLHLLIKVTPSSDLYELYESTYRDAEEMFDWLEARP